MSASAACATATRSWWCRSARVEHWARKMLATSCSALYRTAGGVQQSHDEVIVDFGYRV